MADGGRINDAIVTGSSLEPIQYTNPYFTVREMTVKYGLVYCMGSKLLPVTIASLPRGAGVALQFGLPWQTCLLTL